MRKENPIPMVKKTTDDNRRERERERERNQKRKRKEKEYGAEQRRCCLRRQEDEALKAGYEASLRASEPVTGRSYK